MLRNVTLSKVVFYYPFGNTPAVCLTQDLPPEQDADILLLGCGDVRNVLFTCFADTARKIDVTCCDIEPGIHARNILLYTLLLDDVSSDNIEVIWNIYYHWKLDKKSQQLLETQTQKLLQLSESIDDWHASAYGSSIRFCDVGSLSCVRTYWIGFQLQTLLPSEKKQRFIQLNAAIDKARAYRGEMKGGKNTFNLTGERSAAPVMSDTLFVDFNKVSNQWWENGTTQSSDASIRRATILNPALLYTHNESLTLHYGLSPLYGFPLSTVYSPITKESSLCLQKNGVSSERLVNGAKLHLTQWASAFRKAMTNKSLIIRIFAGDALTFGLTLRNFRLAMPCEGSLNLFSNSHSCRVLTLHRSGYGNDRNAAPLLFDVIDTSNLVDHLGPLNVIPLSSSLLKTYESSILYTELLVVHNSTDRMSDFFGVDVRSLSLLLGLVSPDISTNATNSYESETAADVAKLLAGPQGAKSQQRSRLRWRRFRRCHSESNNYPCLHVKAEELGKLLSKVHESMFFHENPTSFMRNRSLDSPEAMLGEISKRENPHYNRASFALLLNILRVTVITDWRRCVECVYGRIMAFIPTAPVTSNYMQDLFLSMHLYGVDHGTFRKPAASEIDGAILAPALPVRDTLLEQYCVTLKVSRKELQVFTKKSVLELGSPSLQLGIQATDGPWMNLFASVKIAFGDWRERSSGHESCPYIEEDALQLSGFSDMFISAFVPTWFLLQPKLSVPLVKCLFISTPTSASSFHKDLGLDLCIARREMTSKDVFITRYMPGMNGLPIIPCEVASNDSPFITVSITDDGLKINTLTQRVNVESQAAKAKLAIKSSPVKIEFNSPFIAIFSIAGGHKLNIEFPIPVSPTLYNPRIARKSSYVEVSAPLFDPLIEESSAFVCPTFLMNVSSGVTVPFLWTCQRIDLDIMPTINVEDKQGLRWLQNHLSQMFSTREGRIRTTNLADTRTELKDGLFSMFIQYAGIQGPKAHFFGLLKTDGGNQTLIFPSCLRLDMVNHTVVLDAAIMPLTETMFSDPWGTQFFREISSSNLLFSQIKVTEAENRAWKLLMPALVERCRTTTSWNHGSSCEYRLEGEVPLRKGLSKDGVSPLCTCGIGSFPPKNYLEALMDKVPTLSYMIDRYATRGAIGPIFAVPYVENCFLEGASVDKFKHHLEQKSLAMKTCLNCGRSERKNPQTGNFGLLRCAKCKVVSYCSVECQKADWIKHKLICLAA